MSRLSTVPNRLRIVVLNAPYDTLKEPAARRALGDTLALKLEGYRRVYPYGVLPVDSYDLISTHHLVCEEDRDGFHPIMAYRSVTLERCRIHGLAFPGLAVLRSSGAEKHERVLSGLLEKLACDPSLISYGSSWTISPRIPSGSEMRKILKDLMTAMLVTYEEETGTRERFSCGVPTVKSDRYFEGVGYTRVLDSGETGAPLPPFAQASLVGEEAVLLRCSKFSDAARSLAGRYRELWLDRVVIGSGAEAAEERPALKAA